MSCRPSRSIAGVRAGGRVAEVEADRRRHLLGLAARLHVQFDDEVGVRVEAPGEIVRQQRRHLAGRPSEKVTVGIGRRPRDQAVVSRPRIRVVERARRRRRIDPDVGVVHDSRIAGPEFEAADEAPRDRRESAARRCETRRSLRPASVYGCGSVMTRSGFPSCQPSVHCGCDCDWRTADCRLLAFRRAGVGPAPQQRDLRVAQRMLADERAIAGIGLPRRHEPLRGDLRDLRRVPFRVRVGEQAERRRSARVMTHAAAIVQQRRDVFRVGDGLRERS